MTTLIHAFAGNIGIGTTDPGAYKLRVEGAAKMDSLQVNGVTNSHVPIGLISMWYGTIGTIPTGWHVCDGTTGISRTDGAGTIDAPDLRDRFVRGAAGDAAPAPTIQGALGGANTVTLAANNLAAHTHASNTSTDNAPHSHYVDANNAPHTHYADASNAYHAHNSRAANAPHAHGSRAHNTPHNHNTGNINNNHTHPYSIYGLRYGEVPVTVWNGQSMAAYAHGFYYGGNTGNVNQNHSHPVNWNNANHSHYVDASNAPHSHYVDANNAPHGHGTRASDAPHAHNSRAANAPHTHSVTVGLNSTTNDAVTVENPYYALYYIMKI